MFQFKTLFIMRGLPGSGKSSIAQSLVGGECQHVTTRDVFRCLLGKHGVVCTTDAYHYDEWSEDGNYNFNPEKLREFHQKNQDAVRFFMEQNVPGIVVDNTNMRNWEIEPYVDLAKELGYKLVCVEVPHVSTELCAQRNSHGVPQVKIENMWWRKENWNFPGTDGEEI